MIDWRGWLLVVLYQFVGALTVLALGGDRVVMLCAAAMAPGLVTFFHVRALGRKEIGDT